MHAIQYRRENLREVQRFTHWQLIWNAREGAVLICPVSGREYRVSDGDWILKDGALTRLSDPLFRLLYVQTGGGAVRLRSA